MVQVLNDSLVKAAQTLRLAGRLLITLPVIEKGPVELWVSGERLFSARFEEPRFDKILETDNRVIEEGVQRGEWRRDGRVTTPVNEEVYYHKRYDSIDDWLTQELSFCADGDALRAFADQMRPFIPAKHDKLTVEVREQFRDEHQLLCKV